MLRILILVALSLSSPTQTVSGELPGGFVYLSEAAPTIITEPRYYTSNNFVGRAVDGYQSSAIIITKEAAKALKNAQAEFRKKGYSLKVFDAYRPQRAVDHFVRWAKDPDDTLKKAEYYPNVSKDQLFEKGYIAAQSGHSRGSTVDVTLVNLKINQELDMGTPFDFFSPKSWPHSNLVTKVQKQNRILLRGIMMKHGFDPLATEWWHFTLSDEPFGDQYFDFVVR